MQVIFAQTNVPPGVARVLEKCNPFPSNNHMSAFPDVTFPIQQLAAKNQSTFISGKGQKLLTNKEILGISV